MNYRFRAGCKVTVSSWDSKTVTSVVCCSFPWYVGQNGLVWAMCRATCLAHLAKLLSILMAVRAYGRAACLPKGLWTILRSKGMTSTGISQVRLLSSKGVMSPVSLW